MMTGGGWRKKIRGGDSHCQVVSIVISAIVVRTYPTRRMIIIQLRQQLAAVPMSFLIKV
jgi:hypothetical protein